MIANCKFYDKVNAFRAGDISNEKQIKNKGGLQKQFQYQFAEILQQKHKHKSRRLNESLG